MSITRGPVNELREAEMRVNEEVAALKSDHDEAVERVQNDPWAKETIAALLKDHKREVRYVRLSYLQEAEAILAAWRAWWSAEDVADGAAEDAYTKRLRDSQQGYEDYYTRKQEQGNGI